MTNIPRNGARIRLLAMPDDPAPIEVRSEGVVENVQEIAKGHWHVSVRWDNGRTLSLACPPDTWEYTVRHPAITVQLTGEDGNAFAIIGRVRKALRDASLPDAEIRQFADEVMAGNYNQLLMACMRWVTCE